MDIKLEPGDKKWLTKSFIYELRTDFCNGMQVYSR